MSRRPFRGLCVLTILAMLSSVGRIVRADFSFPDFSTVAGLNLNGDAAQVGNSLRLTSSFPGQLGSAWFNLPQQVQNGFQSTFQFQITDLQLNGADGLAFVIQNSSAGALGAPGGAMGYGGIFNSVAVEFDTWQNLVSDFSPTFLLGDPNDNHLSVHTRGTLPNSFDEGFSLGSTTLIPNLSDGSIHIAEITYAAGNLSVFLDDLAAPRLVVALNLATTLNLADGRAGVGFTAATGGAYENHDILNWQFGAVPEPATLWLAAAGILTMCSRRRRRVS